MGFMSTFPSLTHSTQASRMRFLTASWVQPDATLAMAQSFHSLILLTELKGLSARKYAIHADRLALSVDSEAFAGPGIFMAGPPTGVD